MHFKLETAEGVKLLYIEEEVTLDLIKSMVRCK